MEGTLVTLLKERTTELLKYPCILAETLIVGVHYHLSMLGECKGHFLSYD